MNDADAALRELASSHGVDAFYWDWQGVRHAVENQTLRAVLAAFGVDAATPEACQAALERRRRERAARLLPPCIVAREGRAQPIETPVAVAAAHLELEDGSRRHLDTADGLLELPADLPSGYHRLIVTAGVDGSAADIIVAPRRLPLPPRLTQPAWGFAAQLYSVRSRTLSRSWGVGDLGDLAALATWSSREHGADFVLVNPLHAVEVVAPMTASPYLPTTRRFANPLYLRVPSLQEYDRLPGDLRASFERRGDGLRERGELIDRDAAWALKRDALQAVHAAGRGAARQTRFDAYCTREGADLRLFATWCALTEVHGQRWRDWPVELHDPHSAAVDTFVEQHAERVDFYRWLQWQLDEQLASAQQVATESGMALGAIHDVAVGVSPDGADSWMFADVLATGVTVGAPADAYSQLGQDWQQPPWRPDRLAELGYAPLRELYRAALRHCGGLRVDHIIGLFRLWWIPAGSAASAGTYVHYDHEALIGILLLEAQRAGAVIIGEDLGNVEPWVRDYLRERGLFGTSILWFETEDGEPLRPERWRRFALASVTTHDLPPTTGYLAGDHVRLRDRLGMLTRTLEEELAADRHDKQGWLQELHRRGLLPDGAHATADDVVLALHEMLTRSPSLLRCVALTDAVRERRTQNQPGTLTEYPNWQVPLGGPDGEPVWLDDVVHDARVRRLLDAVGSRRRLVEQ